MAFESEDFELVTRHIVMERHLNPAGNLFGGILLAWLDEAAGLHIAEKTGYPYFVTVSMEDVDFKAPGHNGDMVIIYCRIVRTGRSSIEVQLKASSYDVESRESREIITCESTFVALKDGKPHRIFEQ